MACCIGQTKLNNQLLEQGLEGEKQAVVAIMCEYNFFHPTTNRLSVSFLYVIEIIPNPT